MSNFFRLVKLGLTNNLINRTKSKKDIAIILFAYVTIVLSIYFIASELFATAEGFKIVVLLAAILMISLVTILTSAVGASKTLFNFKDFDFLMSLPIKKTSIIVSRIATMYFNTLIMMLVLFAPVLLVYMSEAAVNPRFLITLFLVLLFLPVVPIIIGSIVSVITSYVSSFFKGNKFMNLLSNIVFLVVFYYFYFKYSNVSGKASEVGSMLEALISQINSNYPMAKFYTEALVNNDFVSLLKYIGISVVFLAAFTFLLSKIYLKLNTFLNVDKTKYTFKYRKSKASQFKALCLKEWKRIYGSPTYFLNSLMGSIMIVVGSVYLLTALNQEWLSELMAELDSEMLTSGLIMLLSMFLTTSCTTHSSISLEGRAIHLVKTFPVTLKTYLNSKIFVNLVINTIAIVFGATIINIVFKLEFKYAIFIYLIPLLFSIFNIIFSLMVNLKFPKFDFDNETKVIKQSIPSFVSIMVAFLAPSLLIGAVLSIFNSFANKALIYLSISIILLIINFAIYKTLNIYGINRFKEF